ncbi:GNAT family N-acetyltransferase [Amycolatopsis sp.]|uniref:GNAT family N-acetyltransferase n=1 Tax=Amycolatopsis sp. TaxID=37632 RepID=UPI00345994D0
MTNATQGAAGGNPAAARERRGGRAVTLGNWATEPRCAFRRRNAAVLRLGMVPAAHLAPPAVKTGGRRGDDEDVTRHQLWTITPAPVGDAVSTALLREYFFDVAGRYYGRPATESEVDVAMTEDPSDGLVPPRGQFLLAHREAVLAGCVGVKLGEPGVGTLTRMYVRQSARRQGGAAQLVAAAEDAARGLGAKIMRLDTRHDLVEARALYARSGYAEVDPFSDGKYAEHWFEKALY